MNMYKYDRGIVLPSQMFSLGDLQRVIHQKVRKW
jgi:hypothetical protein